jgi:lipoate-protein ligase A
MGNLNFTFILNSDDYDDNRQTGIILNALRTCGAQCEKNGRNDITLNGRKLSGHAYYHHNGHSYHHGTIMVDVDIERLVSYLNVSDLKLHDRHVKSVRSRVINLKEAVKGIEMNAIRASLISCFVAEYGLEHTQLHENELNMVDLKEEIGFFSDRSWVFKDQRYFEISKQRRFNWGILRIDYNLVGNIISDCQVSSDGMNGDYLAEMAMILKGRNINNLDFLLNDSKNSSIAADVIKLLQEE